MSTLSEQWKAFNSLPDVRSLLHRANETHQLSVGPLTTNIGGVDLGLLWTEAVAAEMDEVAELIGYAMLTRARNEGRLP